MSKIVISRSKMTVIITGAQVEFPKKEFNLLYYLANNQGKALTRKQMIDTVWTEVEVVDRTVDVHIGKLREKIGDEEINKGKGDFRYINTIKGFGYRLSKDLDIKIDDDVSKNKEDAIKTDDDIIISGSYKDNKRNVVSVTNVVDSKFGRLVIFIGAGTSNAMSVKDFRSVYNPL